MKMKVTVGISNRHVHLTKDMYNKLFDCEITKKNDLHQIGEYASYQTLTLKTNNNEIKNVRVVGPFRSYNQIEISKSDALKLNITPPVRDSGDLEDSAWVTLVTPKAEIEIQGCILAHRHVHMNPSEAKKYKVKNRQMVKLIVDGEKGGIMNANIKISENGFYEAHIDIDEASAFNLNNGDEITLEI